MKPHDAPGSAEFHSTQWSLVRTAGQADTPSAREALEELCRRYWIPLYAYARRRMRDVHAAQDAVQEFFSRLLEKNTVSVAEPERGRFRSFLLTAFRNFLSNEREKESALKRGGGRAALSLDFALGEARCRYEPSDNRTPERIYDRQWATTLLDQVLAQLCDSMSQVGKEKHFKVLAPFLAGAGRDGAYAEAARRLGITEGAAMVAAHRLRTRYRKLLRSEIARTLSDPTETEIEVEIRRLFAALAEQ